MKRSVTILGLLTGVAIGASASANTIQFDVNSVSITSGAGFSTAYTGVVNFADDADTQLTDVLINGTSFPLSGILDDFTGQLTISSGSVVGGFYTITMDDGSQFTSTVVLNSGGVVTFNGITFAILGGVTDGVFNNLVGGTDFGGVDVSAFTALPNFGTFTVSEFQPNIGGADDDAGVDIIVEPIPAPGALALAALGGLAAMRRRR